MLDPRWQYQPSSNNSTHRKRFLGCLLPQVRNVPQCLYLAESVGWPFRRQGKSISCKQSRRFKEANPPCRSCLAAIDASWHHIRSRQVCRGVNSRLLITTHDHKLAVLLSSSASDTMPSACISSKKSRTVAMARQIELELLSASLTGGTLCEDLAPQNGVIAITQLQPSTDASFKVRWSRMLSEFVCVPRDVKQRTTLY